MSKKLKTQALKIGVSFDEIKKTLFYDPKVKLAYDELEPAYKLIKQKIQIRIEQNRTQKDLLGKA